MLSAVKRRNHLRWCKSRSRVEARWALVRVRFAESAIRILKSCAAITILKAHSPQFVGDVVGVCRRKRQGLDRAAASSEKSISRALAWGFAILPTEDVQLLPPGIQTHCARRRVLGILGHAAHRRILGAAGRESAPACPAASPMMWPCSPNRCARARSSNTVNGRAHREACVLAMASSRN